MVEPNGTNQRQSDIDVPALPPQEPHAGGRPPKFETIANFSPVMTTREVDEVIYATFKFSVRADTVNLDRVRKYFLGQAVNIVVKQLQATMGLDAEE